MIKKIVVPIDSGSVDDKTVAELRSTLAITEKKIKDILSSRKWSDKELDDIKVVIVQEMKNILKPLSSASHDFKIVKKKIVSKEVEKEISDFLRSEIIALEKNGLSISAIAKLFLTNCATVKHVLEQNKINPVNTQEKKGKKVCKIC